MSRVDRRAPPDPAGLVQRARDGDARSRAKLFSLVEEGGPDARTALDLLAPLTGRGLIVGVTGPPGSGKSTLVTRLAKAIRSGGETVAVLAVDPASPISGGAVLGDRIRMQDLHGDAGAYIRSLSTRGATGGLARAVADMVIVADALGYDVVIVETVGAGQGEVDIASVAPTVVVVEVPHLGDDIQAIKAGVLEVASIYAVNKADQDGADQVAATLRAMLSLAHGRDAWNPPVLKISARTGDGVDRLLEAIRDHRAFLVSSGRLASWPSERARRRLLDGARDRVVEAILESIAPSDLADLVTEIAEDRLTLNEGIDRLTRALSSGRPDGWSPADQSFRTDASTFPRSSPAIPT